ncbi:MAG: ASCH domain-containing protein [Bacteriovoracaceae bacterium]|jgi:uncharacterized protein YhfF|nr:ASCH domain-containing protein [Bacteriovoracaceae bacterium]
MNDFSDQQLAALEQWSFGDNAEMADSLLALVLEGKKTATSGLLKEFQEENELTLQPGDRSIIKDSKNQAVCVVETVKTMTMPFSDMSEDLARLEGEGDLSLEYWRNAHIEFFSKYCEFDESVEIVFEIFKVVHIFS